MEVRDFNTNQLLNGEINVGQEFYIKSKEKPSKDLKLGIKYKYQDVTLYFYQYHSGGYYENARKYQNLVRGELSDKINEIQLEIKVNGNFEKPEIPGTGGTTPELPGEEGTTPELPGEGESRRTRNTRYRRNDTRITRRRRNNTRIARRRWRSRRTRNTRYRRNDTRITRRRRNNTRIARRRWRSRRTRNTRYRQE